LSDEPYELGLARPARRAISELLPEDVAAAAVEFITGALLEAPYRVGRPLRGELARPIPNRRIETRGRRTGHTASQHGLPPPVAAGAGLDEDLVHHVGAGGDDRTELVPVDGLGCP